MDVHTPFQGSSEIQWTLHLPSFPTYDIQTVSIDDKSGLTDRKSIVRVFPAGSAKDLLRSLQAP